MGGPCKEHGNNKLPPVKSIKEEPKKGRKHQLIIYAENFPETFPLESILAKSCSWHQEGPKHGKSKMSGQRPPRN